MYISLSFHLHCEALINSHYRSSSILKVFTGKCWLGSVHFDISSKCRIQEVGPSHLGLAVRRTERTGVGRLPCGFNSTSTKPN